MAPATRCRVRHRLDLRIQPTGGRANQRHGWPGHSHRYNPDLQATLGAVFCHYGLMVRKAPLEDSGNECGLYVSRDSTGGSILSVGRFVGENSSTAQFLLACPVLLPVPESNLVLARENAVCFRAAHQVLPAASPVVRQSDSPPCGHL